MKRAPIDLGAFDWILVNTSGGKDSMTALRLTVQAADEAGFPRARIVCVHADLGEAEWAGAPELARLQAEHYGLRFERVERRQRDGSGDTMVDFAKRRGMWPSAANRWCTSEFKRTPCGRVITMLDREVRRDRRQHVRILQVFGYRAQESDRRFEFRSLDPCKRFSTKSRTVQNWHPIITWSLEEIWQDIHSHAVPHHRAYDLGMSRLSCVFCVLANQADLQVAAWHNPGLLRRYAQAEAEMGHDFQNRKPIGRLLDIGSESCR